jgi:hypothetical protein
MATSKSSRRPRPRTNPTPESILCKSEVSPAHQKAWKAAQGTSGFLRFLVYEQLYLLNLYSGKMIDVLREIDKGFPSALSARRRSCIQAVRSKASQHILETMNGIEITESFLIQRAI